jgi:protoporphyrinogen oxidase
MKQEILIGNLMKRAVVVGAGINGYILAILLAKNGYKVTILESGNITGGQFRGIQVGDYTFDHGLYIPQLTGHKDIDDILLENNPVVERTLQNKDVAGSIYNGKLNCDSMFIDLRWNKSLASKALYSIAEKYGFEDFKTNSTNEYFKNRFGIEAFDRVYKNIIQNVLSQKSDDFDVAALKIFHLSRIILFDNEASLRIKKDHYFDQVIAFPEQMNIPDKFIKDKTPSVYPNNYGLHNLLSSLENQLKKYNISIELGVKLVKLNCIGNVASSITYLKGDLEATIDFEHVAWCGNTYALDGLLGLHTNIAKKIDPAIKQEVSYCVTNEKPKVRNLYWLWDYDDNPVMRISFPHNYSHIPLTDSYLMVIEHKDTGSTEFLSGYFEDEKIISPKSIISIHTPHVTKRGFFNFTKNNVELDREFLKKVEAVIPKNFHLCSRRVSDGEFYLHDLLTTAYKAIILKGVI